MQARLAKQRPLHRPFFLDETGRPGCPPSHHRRGNLRGLPSSSSPCHPSRGHPFHRHGLCPRRFEGAWAPDLELPALPIRRLQESKETGSRGSCRGRFHRPLSSPRLEAAKKTHGFRSPSDRDFSSRKKASSFSSPKKRNSGGLHPSSRFLLPRLSPSPLGSPTSRFQYAP